MAVECRANGNSDAHRNSRKGSGLPCSAVGNGSRGGRKSSSSNKGTLVPVRKYKLYNKHKAIIAAADAVLVAHVREAVIAMFMVCMR